MDRQKSPPPRQYPVQTSQHHPVPDTARPDGKPSNLRLPRTIRAAKDAEQGGGRTIVICLDGTGDKFDNDNSNIVHLVSCLKKDDNSQVTYYQAGIGTYGDTGLSSGITAAMDMAVGSGLGLHVRDAYDFLMHTYKEGDKICLLGFSRGAYTARCLAGMVHKVGLLPPRNVQQVQFAYEFYKDDTVDGWKQSAQFKRTFCIDVNVYFLGLFDSVASVGVIPRTLPLSSTPSSKARYFRHAMALDERRAKFKALRYTSRDWDDIAQSQMGKAVLATMGQNPSSEADKKAMNGDLVNGAQPQASQEDEDDADKKLKIARRAYTRGMDEDEVFDTDVKEVWFLGCHADVGGGAVANDERHKLANIPLRWMVRQCFECNTGILFKARALARCGLDVHSLWPEYRPLSIPAMGPSPTVIDHYERGLPEIYKRGEKLLLVDQEKHHDDVYYDLKIADLEDNEHDTEWLPEQVEDCLDALSVSNDQLVQAKGWWILETLPVDYKVHNIVTNKWETVHGMNLGRYRAVEDEEPLMHWTVRHRMREMKYKINARTSGSAIWKATT